MMPIVDTESINVSQLKIEISKEDVINSLATRQFAPIKKEYTNKFNMLNKLKNEIYQLTAKAINIKNDAIRNFIDEDIEELNKMTESNLKIHFGTYLTDLIWDDNEKVCKGILYINVNHGQQSIDTNKKIVYPYSEELKRICEKITELNIEHFKLKSEVDILRSNCSDIVINEFKNELKDRIVQHAMEIANGNLQKLLGTNKK